jgi:hypothetical protein
MNRRSVIPLIFVLACTSAIFAAPAHAGVVLQYNPTGPQDSTIPLAAAFVADNVTASPLREVGMGAFTNANVLPVGYAARSTEINLSSYVTFTVGSRNGAPLQFTSVIYDKLSYIGVAARNASIRSSVDGFASDIAVLTGLNQNGSQSLTFDISSLRPVAGPVTFRIYFWNATGNDWDDVASTNHPPASGLRVNADFVTGAAGAKGARMSSRAANR